MKHMRAILFVVLSAVAITSPSFAARFILRPVDNTPVQNVAGRHGLTVLGAVDDNHGSVYLVAASDLFTPDQVVAEVSADLGVVDIEPDRKLNVPELQAFASAHLNQSTTAILDQIAANSPAKYYGKQTAISVMHLDAAHTLLGVKGTGVTVAIIDTGIDPNHAELKASVVPGFDFTRNRVLVDEFDDISATYAAVLRGTNKHAVALVSQSTTAILDQSTTAILDQSTTAILDQSTTAILDQSTTAILDGMPKAFGHGTMVAGLVHLAAPAAKIMPLKAFHADGTAQLSDILRAIYFAANHGAKVINMSFSLSDDSVELKQAVGYAQNLNCVSVASTGNTGLGTVSFPAKTAKVIGVASIGNSGVRSTFSSFGAGTWVAAPGELVVTTYPGGHWAAASGTSFSSPLVAGTAALVKQILPLGGFSNVSQSFAFKRRLGTELGYGIADAYQTLIWAKSKL